MAVLCLDLNLLNMWFFENFWNKLNFWKVLFYNKSDNYIGCDQVPKRHLLKNGDFGNFDDFFENLWKGVLLIRLIAAAHWRRAKEKILLLGAKNWIVASCRYSRLSSRLARWHRRHWGHAHAVEAGSLRLCHLRHRHAYRLKVSWFSLKHQQLNFRDFLCMTKKWQKWWHENLPPGEKMSWP